MIGKVGVLLAVLVSVAAGQDFIGLLAKIREERGFAENPCVGQTGISFVANTRGCSWFWQCNDENIVRQDRCPGEFHFNPANSICDYRENVNCELDVERPFLCPAERAVTVIPHPYSCELTKLKVCGFNNYKLYSPTGSMYTGQSVNLEVL